MKTPTQKILAAALIGLCIALPAAAAEITVPLPDRTSLKMTVPDDWQASYDRTDLPQTPLTLKSNKDQNFRIELTFERLPATGRQPPDQATLLAMAGRAKDGVVESYAGKGRTGVVTSTKEPNPKPSGYKFKTHGLVFMGNLMIAVKLESNDQAERHQAELRAAMDSIRLP